MMVLNDFERFNFSSLSPELIGEKVENPDSGQLHSLPEKLDRLEPTGKAKITSLFFFFQIELYG